MKENAVLMGILVVGSVIDLRWKRIPGWLILIGIAGGFCMASIADWEKTEWIIWIVSSVLFLMICRWSSQEIGYGDGMIWSVMVLYLGIWKSITIWMTALILVFFFSITALILRKAGRKTAFPFLPFLTVAYGICMMKSFRIFSD